MKTNFKLQKAKSVNDIENNIIYLKENDKNLYIKHSDEEYSIKDFIYIDYLINSIPIGKIIPLEEEEYKRIKNIKPNLNEFFKEVNLNGLFSSKGKLIFLEKIKNVF